MALRVGYEKLNLETGWEPQVSWEDGVRKTIQWYAENRERWLGRVDWLPYTAPTVSGVTAADVGHGRRRASSARTSSSACVRAATSRSSPRRREYDLTRWDDTERLFADAKPELVFHLAAEVGGIGANRANPGRYWYANLMMGAHVLEQARLHGVDKLVDRRHGLRVPEVHAGAVPRGRPLERLPRGDERAVRRREEVAARRRAGLPRAVRAERDLPAAGEPLRAARQLPPDERARDPRPDPQDDRRRRGEREVVLWGDGSPTREFLYVDDCGGRRRARRASATTAPSPSTSARARRSRSATSPS